MVFSRANLTPVRPRSSSWRSDAIAPAGSALVRVIESLWARRLHSDLLPADFVPRGLGLIRARRPLCVWPARSARAHHLVHHHLLLVPLVPHVLFLLRWMDLLRMARMDCTGMVSRHVVTWCLSSMGLGLCHGAKRGHDQNHCEWMPTH